MSFLLDALRKTEDRKHLREVPTIYSSGPGVERPPRRYGPLVLVLLPAFLVLIWSASRQFAGPADGLVTPKASRAVDSRPVTGPGAAPPVAKPSPGPKSVVPQKPAGEQKPGSTARTPVESLDLPVTAAEVRAAPDPAPESPVSARPVPEPGPAASVALREPEPAPQPKPESEPYQPPKPSLITYWQLPATVRGELPEFRISVLVYAERAEDRFILLNGKRLMEGDSYMSGLVMDEIRRDGAVFSYRLYRFLVAR
jgi:hypothetical protein